MEADFHCCWYKNRSERVNLLHVANFYHSWMWKYNLVQYLKNVKALHKRASASLAAKDVAGTDQESVFAGLVLCQL